MSNQAYPAFPEGSDQQAYQTGTEQPPSIKTAVTLMRAGAAISVVSIIITLLTLGTIKDQVEEGLQGSGSFTQAQVDSSFQAFVVVAIVVGLIGVAVWLWMASANGKGKKWARITATILGVLNLLFFLLGLSAGNAPALSLLISILSVGVGLGALFFMYRPDASAYYEANSRS